MPKIGDYPDALGWWKKYNMTFPCLAFLAKKYLSIQATSAPSERIFSKAIRIISERCTILGHTVAWQLLYVACNHEWYTLQLQQKDSEKTE